MLEPLVGHLLHEWFIGVDVPHHRYVFGVKWGVLFSSQCRQDRVTSTAALLSSAHVGSRGHTHAKYSQRCYRIWLAGQRLHLTGQLVVRAVCVRQVVVWCDTDGCRNLMKTRKLSTIVHAPRAAVADWVTYDRLT